MKRAHLDPVHCLLASQRARVEHWEEDGGQGAEGVVDGGVVNGNAAAGEGGAEEVYLGGGDEVAGVDKVDQGADLKLVAAHGG